MGARPAGRHSYRGGSHPSGVGSISRRGPRDPASPLARLAGGSLYRGWTTRARLGGDRRGFHTDGDHGGALVGGRVVSSQGGTAAPAPEPRGPPGGSVFPAGPRGRPPAAGQGVRATGRPQPESPVAAAA